MCERAGDREATGFRVSKSKDKAAGPGGVTTFAK